MFISHRAIALTSVWFLLFAVGFTRLCLAQDKIIYYKGDKLLRKRGKEEKTPKLNLRKWEIQEESDTVQAALDVYKNKTAPIYSKKIWIADRRNKEKSIIMEFTTDRGSAKILFSPNEEFVYYLGLTDEGKQMVYGINLLTEEQFPIALANDFSMITCGKKESYVVVEVGDAQRTHDVYNLMGNKLDSVSGDASTNVIKRYICY